MVTSNVDGSPLSRECDQSLVSRQIFLVRSYRPTYA